MRSEDISFIIIPLTLSCIVQYSTPSSSPPTHRILMCDAAGTVPFLPHPQLRASSPLHQAQSDARMEGIGGHVSIHLTQINPLPFYHSPPRQSVQRATRSPQGSMPLLMPNLTITNISTSQCDGSSPLQVAQRSTVPVDREDATVVVPSSSHIMICVRRTAVDGMVLVIHELPRLCPNFEPQFGSRCSFPCRASFCDI